MAIFFLTIFMGSTPSDFPDSSGVESPFSPCPDTPNCVIHAVEYDLPAVLLFNAAKKAVRKMNPHELHVYSESFQIDAMYRIPLFGFKDDFKLLVQLYGNDRSILHIKSASRVGYSDLGVNRRRVNRILKRINTEIKTR